MEITSKYLKTANKDELAKELVCELIADAFEAYKNFGGEFHGAYAEIVVENSEGEKWPVATLDCDLLRIYYTGCDPELDRAVAEERIARDIRTVTDVRYEIQSDIEEWEADGRDEDDFRDYVCHIR